MNLKTVYVDNDVADDDAQQIIDCEIFSFPFEDDDDFHLGNTDHRVH